MFIKILDPSKPQASTLLSEVRDIYKRLMTREDAATHYDSSLIKLPRDSKEDVWCLYITNHNNNSYYLLAEIGAVFIMNNDGKTIDKF